MRFTCVKMEEQRASQGASRRDTGGVQQHIRRFRLRMSLYVERYINGSEKERLIIPTVDASFICATHAGEIHLTSEANLSRSDVPFPL